MKSRYKYVYLLVALHLIMVVLYASHFAEWGAGKSVISRAAGTVGHYTGSNNIFSFFAPGLSDQPYVIYTILDSSGKEYIIDLKGKSPDFSNRVNNIYGYLTLEEGRQIFSASLSRFILNKYPDAQKVRVAMVVQKIPTMDQYRNGERCQWRFWFHRDFQRDSAVFVSQ